MLVAFLCSERIHRVVLRFFHCDARSFCRFHRGLQVPSWYTEEPGNQRVGCRIGTIPTTTWRVIEVFGTLLRPCTRWVASWCVP